MNLGSLRSSSPRKRGLGVWRDKVVNDDKVDVIIGSTPPRALAKARPGTAEFRQALRDAIEATRDLPASHGVFTLLPADHSGMDQRSRVMVRIEGGGWKIMP